MSYNGSIFSRKGGINEAARVERAKLPMQEPCACSIAVENFHLGRFARNKYFRLDFR